MLLAARDTVPSAACLYVLSRRLSSEDTCVATETKKHMLLLLLLLLLRGKEVLPRIEDATVLFQHSCMSP